MVDQAELRGGQPPREISSNFLVDSGIYHAMFRLFERVGVAKKWGDNTEIHAEFVKTIPKEVRHKKLFRMLLLGSATETSIHQALDALKTWEEQGIISDGKLTVIDVSRKGYNNLDPELQRKIEFAQADIRRPPFKDESFDFITSDYIFNFIPREQTAQAIKSLSLLLTPGGVFDSVFALKRRQPSRHTWDNPENPFASIDPFAPIDRLIEKIDNKVKDFFDRKLTEEELNVTMPTNCVLLPPRPAQLKRKESPERIDIVWGFQKAA